MYFRLLFLILNLKYIFSFYIFQIIQFMFGLSFCILVFREFWIKLWISHWFNTKYISNKQQQPGGNSVIESLNLLLYFIHTFILWYIHVKNKQLFLHCISLFIRTSFIEKAFIFFNCIFIFFQFLQKNRK